jgi:hypothetical protein
VPREWADRYKGKFDMGYEAMRVQTLARQKQLGIVPNLFRLVSNSPAALEGYLGMLGALGKGALPAATRERSAGSDRLCSWQIKGTPSSVVACRS